MSTSQGRETNSAAEAPTRPSPRAQQCIRCAAATIATHDVTHAISSDDSGKVQYTISAKRMLSYADGRQILDDADILLPDRNGRTPLGLARSRGYGDMAAILQTVGAR